MYLKNLLKVQNIKLIKIKIALAIKNRTQIAKKRCSQSFNFLGKPTGP